MAAKRYWRLWLNPREKFTYKQLAEIELRTSVGGADQCSGGTAIGTYVTFPPANAFDDSNATVWQSVYNWVNQDGAYVGYDFGAGNDKDIVEIAVTNGTTSSYYPEWCEVQCSDDGSTWETVGRWRFAPWTTTNETYVFPVDAGVNVARNVQLASFYTPFHPPARANKGLFIQGRPGYPKYRRHDYTGPYRLAGVITLATGQPTKKRVDILRQRSSTLVERVFSNPSTGTWEVNDLSEGPWTVLHVDSSGAENSIVRAHVTAELP